VLAYDRLAPEFAQVSQRRRAYLDAIDQLVISEIPAGVQAFLDIGAGDGTRALRIAKAIGVEKPVLLEPSEAMRAQWPPGTHGWPIRAENLNLQRDEQFDVITCLWNVVGHIFPLESRIEVLRQCARLLSPDGQLFIDVNHRYNALHYGFVATLLRVLRDRIFPNQSNGDVTAHWDIAGTKVSTNGHVFTDVEFRSMAQSGGLSIKKALSIDYATGEVRRSRFSGNLFYILQRSSEA
jgi:SAM-dependent methyltransferase